jgi:hypothetical protein
MTISEYLRFAQVRAAAAILVLAVLFAAWSLVDAVRSPDIQAVATKPATMVALAAPRAFAPVDVDAAVEADLFSPDRNAPDEPFRMPGDPATRVAQTSGPTPRVLGTAVAPDGSSFATAQLAAGTPRIIRRGDRLGDYTVTSIARGHVVFTAVSGTQIDIAATAAPTQDSFNASISQIVAPDTAFRGFYGRGAAGFRGRGRPRRDSIPPG